MREIGLLGLNHKTAPLEIRERLAFVNLEELKEGLNLLKKERTLKEALILSTCNRVELYAVSPQLSDVLLFGVLEKLKGVSSGDITAFCYFKVGEEAVRHLFLVASSLDSMVIGEPQIMGQLKEAYEVALKAGTVGFFLHRLFQRAFFVGKRVRRETGIGDGAISVSYVAVELAKKIFGDLENKRILIVGAGEMCELAARHFHSHGVKEIMVANRTWQRGVELASKIGGRPIPFEEVKERFKEVDIILSSTGASQPLIFKEDVKKALKYRKGSPLFIIDLAVPRDVEPEVNQLDGVFLYDIDDLKQVAQEHAINRLNEAERARELVEEEVGKFIRWYRSLEVVPTIKDLREWAETLRKKEMERLLRGLSLDEKERHKVELLSKRLMNKFLHPLVVFLKAQAWDEDSKKEYSELIRCLFGLEDQ
jgi:glutamyl-tRNA reductase